MTTLRKINQVRKEFLQQGKDLVWHGMTHEQFKKLMANEGQMRAYTTQRYWKDGKLRKDNQPDYNDSYWYHGWSFSRSKNVSAGFGEIVWAFDLNEVKKEFKVIPISWNFTIGRLNPQKINHKREQEEFVIAHKGKHSLEEIAKKSQEYEARSDIINELLWKHKQKEITLSPEELTNLEKEEKEIEKFYDTNWFEKIMAGPKGKNLDVNKKAKGFFVVNKFLRPEEIQKLSEHHQFLGVIEPKDLEPEIQSQQSTKLKMK